MTSVNTNLLKQIVVANNLETTPTMNVTLTIVIALIVRVTIVSVMEQILVHLLVQKRLTRRLLQNVSSASIVEEMKIRIAATVIVDVVPTDSTIITTVKPLVRLLVKTKSDETTQSATIEAKMLLVGRNMITSERCSPHSIPLSPKVSMVQSKLKIL